ncbi:hypothetical protein LCGC14_2951560, partial [marine sediment metagenome]
KKHIPNELVIILGILIFEFAYFSFPDNWFAQWFVFRAHLPTLVIFSGMLVGLGVSYYEYHGIGPQEGIVRRGANHPRIALTFDDGPNPEHTNGILDILKDVKQGIVVFSWFSSYLNYLYTLLDSSECDIVTGQQDPTSRHRAIEHFQAGGSRIMLASIKAGGEGIDLTAASVCLFTDITWVPGDSKQAEDRLHRYGQKSAVTVLRLVHPNTVDEDMHKINEQKARAFTEIVAIREAVDSMTQRQQVRVLV